MAEAIQSEVIADDVHANCGFTRTMDHTREDHVQQVLRQANEELRSLLRRRAELVKRIGTVKQTIAGLANLFGPENEILLSLPKSQSQEVLAQASRKRAVWF